MEGVEIRGGADFSQKFHKKIIKSLKKIKKYIKIFTKIKKFFNFKKK
jgi:hypothetical protein